MRTAALQALERKTETGTREGIPPGWGSIGGLVWNTYRMTDFEGADLRGAQFREVDLTDARVEGANLTNVKMSDVWLVNVDIDGMFNGVKINGVDVTAYVSAELARINPERALMEPTDPEGMRAAWSAVSSLWDATIERAQQLPRGNAARVGRRRVFVRANASPLGVRDRQVVHRADPRRRVRPDRLAEHRESRLPVARHRSRRRSVVRRRAGRASRSRARFAKYLADLEPADLTQTREVLENGNAPVQACLHVVFEEEMAHHGYATRDLDALERS